MQGRNHPSTENGLLGKLGLKTNDAMGVVHLISIHTNKMNYLQILYPIEEYMNFSNMLY